MIEQTLLPEVVAKQKELNEQGRTEKWKAYTEYKDSGVEWLGEIPAYWEVRRLKFIVAMNSEVLSATTSADYALQYVDIGNVDSEGRITDVKELLFSNAPSRARRLVKHNDIIISTVRTYLKAISYIESPPDNLAVSTGFAVLRPHPECYAKFLWRLLQSDEFVHTIVSYSQGVSYPAITPSNLSSLPIWFPPLLEQHTISSFLDREIARINILIAKKEQHLALLQEQRTAIINQAVTKGLNTDVPMKDSGIEWLGEIPMHWYRTVIKRCLSSLKDGTHGTFQRVAEGIPLLSAKNVENGILRVTDEESLISETDYKSIHQNGYLKTGDLLLTIVGTIGRTAIFNYPEPVAFQRSVAVLRVHKEHSTEYFCYLIQTGLVQTYLKSRTKQSAQSGVYLIDVSLIPVIIPPFPEQQSIVAYLDQETTKIDKLITGIKVSIKKLKEYSTALVSAAVTGKIDVRGEVATRSTEVATI